MNLGEEEEVPLFRLTEGLSLSDFVNKGGGEFTVDSLTTEDYVPTEEAYDLATLSPYLNEEAMEIHSDETESFQSVREKSDPLTEDGKVMKLLRRPGGGEDMPNPATVFIHYAFYVEGSAAPFDISYINQNHQKKVVVGVGRLFLGLEIALLSMKKREKATFLVHSDLAFGAQGCAPRIPPKATIMMDIEVFNFCEYTEIGNESASLSSRRFEDTKEHAIKLVDIGNQYKRERKPGDAIRSYRRALNLLLGSSLRNKEEESEMRREACRVYTNLAICYAGQGDWRKVCQMANGAYRDSQYWAHNNTKLLYQSGKALYNLGNYEESIKRLKQAQHLEPTVVAVNSLLLKARNELKKAKEVERKQWARGLGLATQNHRQVNQDETHQNQEQQVSEDSLDPEFVDEMREQLTIFKDDEAQDRLSLPHTLTQAEIDCCKRICNQIGLQHQELWCHGSRLLVILKSGEKS